MSAQACKIIIDNGVRALNESLERILVDPDIHREKLPEDVRMDLIQRLADIDTVSFTGNLDLMPQGGMAGIMDVLEEHGLVTDEVWVIYRRPGSTASAHGKSGGKSPHGDEMLR